MLNNKLYYKGIVFMLLVSTFLTIPTIKSVFFDEKILDEKMSYTRLRENKLKEFERKSENVIINRKCKLYDKNGNELLLGNIINKKCLIYRFSEHSCWACVERDIINIEQFSKKNSNTNIIVIANYDIIRKLKVLLVQLNITVSCYNSNDKLGLILEDDENHPPFYFVTDSDLKTKFVHTSTPGLGKDNSYFDLLSKYFTI